ncbi:MAG: Sec-independent protein translocase protein TatB [Clostridium sp.]|nr:Sec-independent protein translocase protein TatB [Clostridium sp.]
MSLGFGEILVVLIIAFVVVGPKDLPKIARAMARLIRQFRQMYGSIKDSLSLEEEMAEIRKAAADAAPPSGSLTKELADIRREINKAGSTKI